MSKITLATLASATAQQVFEQVRDHLLRQGKRATTSGCDDGSCSYRGHEGAMCAAGCLIDDSEYTPRMEGKLWGQLVDTCGVPTKHRRLIRSLQLIHDSVEPAGWELELRGLARLFDLAWTITLATLPTARAQEVFEQAAKHLLKQNARSTFTVGGARCAYRGVGGLACAAGALLSDADIAVFSDEQLGASWRWLSDNGGVPRTHFDLIRGLQKTHDSYEPDEWRDELRHLAKVHSLDSSFMDLPLVVYVPPAL